jgi:hypothetical protein
MCAASTADALLLIRGLRTVEEIYYAVEEGVAAYTKELTGTKCAARRGSESNRTSCYIGGSGKPFRVPL